MKDIEETPALLTIVSALLLDLQEKYREIQIIRNGSLQITLFRPWDFQYAQLVLGLHGLFLVPDNVSGISHALQEAIDWAEPLPEGIRGPMALEDPDLLSTLYMAIDAWLN